jgi:hypothetical protein
LAKPTLDKILNVTAAGVVASGGAYDINERTFITYTLTNPGTGQVYIGRASGIGDPYSVMMQRYGAHHMKACGFVNPTLDKAIQGWSGYPAIRGREQQLIDYYGGIGDPKVANAIRGVAEENVAGTWFWNESNRRFGPLSPYTGRVSK